MTAKYVIIVPDGAADEPIDQLDGRTVLEAANTTNLDLISNGARLGMVRTVPQGMPAGSDVAQMSLLGYDPLKVYTGRAPIEAEAQGIDLSPEDWVFRCNLVTFADGKMADHSAGHISTEEAAHLIDDLEKHLAMDNVKFYPGVSYRHLCVIRGLDFDLKTQPPHDHIGTGIKKLLPKGKNSQIINEMMARSQEFFEASEINRLRTELGENPASSIWLWGEGRKASLESFESKFGLKGAAITAVDLVRGLARLIGFDIIEVPGATGYVDTNYNGKAAATIAALEDHDIVFVHVEGPDEAAHTGNLEAKIEAVEKIDKYIIGPVYKHLKDHYDIWRLMVLPDHPTPISTQSHSEKPVPFVICGSGVDSQISRNFSEKAAGESGLFIENGFELMEYYLKS